MCGILGFTSCGLTQKDIKKNIKRSAEHIKNRGPDVINDLNIGSLNLVLAHARLSILDLSAKATQPMQSHDKNCALVFNGEIYNYLELKKELKEKGYTFYTSSDTEVLLASLQTFGLDLTLKKIAGMFAFAYIDIKKKKMHLCRDRAGEKPLYYATVNKNFIFSSEINAIEEFTGFEKKIDDDSLNMLLTTGAIPAPFTIYKGVFKLEAAKKISLDLPFNCDKKIVQEEYWSFLKTYHKEQEKNYSINELDFVEQMDKSLSEVVKSHLNADVEVGLFLSGGVDSSLLASIMKKQSDKNINTFTIGFSEGDYNESHRGASVAKFLGTNHSEITLDTKKAQEIIKLLPDVYQEPFADSSAIATYLVANLAKKKIKVALVGDGADELFFGYSRYVDFQKSLTKKHQGHILLKLLPINVLKFLLKLCPKFIKTPLSLIEAKLKRYEKITCSSSWQEKYENYTYASSYANLLIPSSRSLLNPKIFKNYSKENVARNIMAHDFMLYLSSDILTKTDRAAMFNSLETRCPFLDKRWLDLVLKVPANDHKKNDSGKYLLKKLLYKKLPQVLVDRKKQGFAVPIGKWLRGDLKDWAQKLLFSKSSYENINQEEKLKLWNELQKGNDDYNSIIWSLLMFENWYKKKFNKD